MLRKIIVALGYFFSQNLDNLYGEASLLVLIWSLISRILHIWQAEGLVFADFPGNFRFLRGSVCQNQCRATMILCNFQMNSHQNVQIKSFYNKNNKELQLNKSVYIPSFILVFALFCFVFCSFFRFFELFILNRFFSFYFLILISGAGQKQFK